MYDEDQHCKDVYAHYGVAMYFAQCLERGIGTFLSAGLGPDRPATIEEFDALLETHQRSTLGRLVAKLQGVRVTPTFQDDLQRALDARNWIAHRYFWDRAAHFMTREGRDFMIAELERARDLFMEMEREFSRVTLTWLRRHGLTDETMAEEERKLLGEAHDDLLGPSCERVISRMRPPGEAPGAQWQRPNGDGSVNPPPAHG